MKNTDKGLWLFVKACLEASLFFGAASLGYFISADLPLSFPFGPNAWVVWILISSIFIKTFVEYHISVKN